MHEISMKEKKLSLKTLNETKAKDLTLFWKPSDEDIRRGLDRIPAQVRLTLRGELHGFLINGRFYYPPKAKIWAMKRSLSINYLLKLTEVILVEGHL